MAALITVSVRSASGSLYNIQLGGESTIGTLKSKLEGPSSLEPDKQRLIFKGKVLADDSKALSGECTCDFCRHFHFSVGFGVPALASTRTFAPLRRLATPCPSPLAEIGIVEGSQVYLHARLPVPPAVRPDAAAEAPPPPPHDAASDGSRRGGSRPPGRPPVGLGAMRFPFGGAGGPMEGSVVMMPLGGDMGSGGFGVMLSGGIGGMGLPQRRGSSSGGGGGAEGGEGRGGGDDEGGGGEEEEGGGPLAGFLTQMLGGLIEGMLNSSGAGGAGGVPVRGERWILPSLLCLHD
jgi:hypothetical protein